MREGVGGAKVDQSTRDGGGILTKEDLRRAVGEGVGNVLQAKEEIGEYAAYKSLMDFETSIINTLQPVITQEGECRKACLGGKDAAVSYIITQLTKKVVLERKELSISEDSLSDIVKGLSEYLVPAFENVALESQEDLYETDRALKARAAFTPPPPPGRPIPPVESREDAAQRALQQKQRAAVFEDMVSKIDGAASSLVLPPKPTKNVGKVAVTAQVLTAQHELEYSSIGVFGTDFSNGRPHPGASAQLSNLIHRLDKDKLEEAMIKALTVKSAHLGISCGRVQELLGKFNDGMKNQIISAVTGSDTMEQKHNAMQYLEKATYQAATLKTFDRTSLTIREKEVEKIVDNVVKHLKHDSPLPTITIGHGR